MKINITAHALERLEDRAYLKYFRTLRIGETREKWLLKWAKQAIDMGYETKVSKIHSNNSRGFYFKGIVFIFSDCGKIWNLLTLYQTPAPKKLKKE